MGINRAHGYKVDSLDVEMGRAYARMVQSIGRTRPRPVSLAVNFDQHMDLRCAVSGRLAPQTTNGTIENDDSWIVQPPGDIKFF